MPAVLSAVLLALAIATPAAAGEVSLPDAWAAALRTHEDVLRSGAAVDAARADRAGARAGLLPRIGASGGWTATGGDDGESSVLSARLAASQALVDTATWAALRASGARLAAAEAGAEGVRIALLHAVAGVWYAALAADAAVAAREEALAVEEALLAGVSAQAAAGAAIPLAITRQRVSLAEARSALAAARSDRAVGRLALARLTGLDVTDATLTDPGPVPDPPAPDRPPPVVRAAEARASAAEATLRAARGGRLPEVQAWGEATSDEPVAGGEASLAWQGGIQASVPVFAGGAVTAAVDAARADLDAAQADLDAARRDADLARATALAVQHAAEARAGAASDAEAAARENLAGVRVLLIAGRATAIEVSDAGAALARSGAEAIRARLDRDLATLAAWQALGLPPPGAPP